MKKIILLTIINFTFILLYSQQIPNGNFENWTNDSDAEGWNSVNIGFPVNFYSAQQTTDSYQGTYAANLTTESTALGVIPGIITLGEIDIENQTITGGIPFTERPNGISYFFKYVPQGNDTSVMISILTKWNETTQETDTIAMTAYFTADQFDVYTKVAVPYIYNSIDSPDSLNVIFISSGFSGNAGSSLLIDSIALEYGTVVSPTICFPANDTTSTQFTANWMPVPDLALTSYSIDVSDNNVFSTFASGYENADAGLNTLYTVTVPAGLYFYRVRVHYGTEVSINSNTVAIPMPAECYEATNITYNSFTAGWQATNNATNYYIDVSEDVNFTTFAGGYENYSVGNSTNISVSSLNQNTEYFYRIRTEYDTYVSKNSNTVSVNTTASEVSDIEKSNVTIIIKNMDVIIYSDINNIAKNIEVYDISGKLINKIIRTNAYEKITFKNKGIYLLKFEFDDYIITKKVII
ncbi:MAG: T9SS type A sorting domain-containing protein [Bacteroidales bacterium]|nr:T9SS type A sorting domain-containing protein [Bacteroidales bacterium]